MILLYLKILMMIMI